MFAERDHCRRDDENIFSHCVLSSSYAPVTGAKNHVSPSTPSSTLRPGSQRNGVFANVRERANVIVQVDVAQRANALGSDVQPGEGVEHAGRRERDAADVRAHARTADDPRPDHRAAAVVAAGTDESRPFRELPEETVALHVRDRERDRCLRRRGHLVSPPSARTARAMERVGQTSIAMAILSSLSP